MPDAQRPRAPKSRTPSTRHLKGTVSYTYCEAAKAMGVHKTAVRRWAREGLCVDTSLRPHLVRGDELVRFCSVRRSKRRQKCAETEFYCCKCHAPSKPYEMAIDLQIMTNGRLALKSICSVCETRVFKVQPLRNIPKIARTFAILKVEGKHLLDCIEPTLKSHLEGHI